MKKFFAAFLAISVTAALTGCGKPADGQLIDEITDYNNAAESDGIYGEPRLAQQEDMLGAWISNNKLYFFVPDNIYETADCKISALNAVMKNGELDFGETSGSGNMFFCGDTVYINSDSEPPVSVTVYERYEQKLLNAGDLEGHCQIYKNNTMLGDAFFENGKGIINGFDENFFAEIYVNEDKITMTVDGETNNYDYYIINKKSVQKTNSAFTTMSAVPDSSTYVYLANSKDFIAIKKSEIITGTQMDTVSETSVDIAEDKKKNVIESSEEAENIFADHDRGNFPKGLWQDSYFYTYDRDENGNITYNYYDENETNIYSYCFKNYSDIDGSDFGEPLSQKDSHIFEFDGEGHFRVALQTHDVFGKYTFEDNILTLTFKTDFYDKGEFINKFSFEVLKEENGYRLCLDISESEGMIDLPARAELEQTSYMELAAGLSSLFDTFFNRKSFFIEYIGDANADNFKSYIEYINEIS